MVGQPPSDPHSQPQQDQPIAQSQPMPIESNTTVLLLGRSGSGKTSLINTIFSDPKRAGDRKSIDSTVDVNPWRFKMRDRMFELFDTPGFDNVGMSNFEAWMRIGSFLTQKPIRVTDIVYIHRQYDATEGRALRQNQELLFNSLLGQSGVSRLKIVVLLEKSGTSDPAGAIRLLSRTPGFSPILAQGAEIVALTLDRAAVLQLLLSLSPCDSRPLQIQHDFELDPNFDLGSRIEASLGSYEKDSLDRYVSRYRQKARSLEKTVEKHVSKISELSEAYDHTERQLSHVQDEALALRHQHQQTQKEYASLRSQLQLQENIEQAEIVQALKTLNRTIDDVARELSAFLVDNFVQLNTGKPPSDVTALDARDLPGLKQLLGHTDSESSLVTSSDGVGMPIEDCFDYATRTLLCKHLCRYIFYPFHPSVDSSQSSILTLLYQNIRQQESQIAAAKWRISSFKTICKLQEVAKAGHIHKITDIFFNKPLTNLVNCFFEPSSEIRLQRKLVDRLEQLFRLAWEWNSTIKGEVAVLGDFHPVYYPSLSPFNSNSMEEFEPGRDSARPEYILSTIGLGLSVSHAVGSGREPETTIVLKTTVATKRLYTKDE